VFGATANTIAGRLGVVGANRAGRGAVKGSWSGRMSPALRIAPTLAAMVRAGLVESYLDPDAGWRNLYALTDSGKRLAG